MNWTEFDLDMPEGIVVLKGENKKIPLKAYVAKIDMNIPGMQIRVLSSSDKDRKNTPMEFLNETGARIILNGGYFISDKDPAQHVGLLIMILFSKGLLHKITDLEIQVST